MNNTESTISLKDKLNAFVDQQCEYASKDGRTKYSTCNHSNWDRDIWYFRHDIADIIRSRGFNVRVECNWGVMDYFVTAKIV